MFFCKSDFWVIRLEKFYNYQYWQSEIPWTLGRLANLRNCTEIYILSLFLGKNYCMILLKCSMGNNRWFYNGSLSKLYSLLFCWPYISLYLIVFPVESWRNFDFHFPSPVDHSILWSFLYNPINKFLKI